MLHKDHCLKWESHKLHHREHALPSIPVFLSPDQHTENENNKPFRKKALPLSATKDFDLEFLLKNFGGFKEFFDEFKPNLSWCYLLKLDQGCFLPPQLKEDRHDDILIISRLTGIETWNCPLIQGTKLRHVEMGRTYVALNSSQISMFSFHNAVTWMIAKLNCNENVIRKLFRHLRYK